MCLGEVRIAHAGEVVLIVFFWWWEFEFYRCDQNSEWLTTWHLLVTISNLWKRHVFSIGLTNDYPQNGSHSHAARAPKKPGIPDVRWWAPRTPLALTLPCRSITQPICDLNEGGGWEDEGDYLILFIVMSYIIGIILMITSFFNLFYTIYYCYDDED